VKKKAISSLSSLELCAGAGGQALGLEQAGFGHAGLVEIEAPFCETLRLNRPNWNVINDDLRLFKNVASRFKGIDLLAGGLPCPPFSVAGKQLGELDERNLFPDALEIIDATRPKAVMIENVRGFLDAVFEDYRIYLKSQLSKLGYSADWRLLNASDYGVPQLRPRVVIVAIRKEFEDRFAWPEPLKKAPPTVGETLKELMSENGWLGVDAWAKHANGIGPTIVGGSKKHGGPDLGPTRAKSAWRVLGVDGLTIAEEAPQQDFIGTPKLTVRMVARIQGFPSDWKFAGRKTIAYRQVGNAFPPPVARAVASKLMTALTKQKIFKVS
jgi:DNA (cytosine-5)-methyltransferase 1